VLLFEGLFHFRLPNIHREKKQTSVEKLHNMQELISTMEWTVGFSLQHIDAQGILDGEPKHLCLLIQIFNELCHIVESQQRTELELRRPLSPIPNELENEDYDENQGSQTDEVSQWCDTVLRESNLTDHVREVVSLNPDYHMSSSSSPNVSTPVQLLSLSSQQQRKKEKQQHRPGDAVEDTESDRAVGETQSPDARKTLLHPRPLAAIPVCQLPPAVAALRQPHLSPHAFLPMHKITPSEKLEAEQKAKDVSLPDAQDVPMQIQDFPPTTMEQAEPTAPQLLATAMLQDPTPLQIQSPWPPEPVLQSTSTPQHTGPPPTDPKPVLPKPPIQDQPPMRPLAPAEPKSCPQAATSARHPSNNLPKQTCHAQLHKHAHKQPLRAHDLNRPQQRTKPHHKGAPLQRRRDTSSQRLSQAQDPSQALVRRILGDEKREMLRARRFIENQQQLLQASCSSKRGREHAALVKLFRLLLKRERGHLREERARLKEHQKQAAQERLQQQAALENYYVTQHEMLTEQFQRVAECRRLQEKHQKQALDKLRREARDRQLRSLEQYYQKLCSEDDAKFHRSSVERLLKHFGLNS
jgi:hypothetical protein